jgi:hypothetical protein
MDIFIEIIKCFNFIISSIFVYPSTITNVYFCFMWQMFFSGNVGEGHCCKRINHKKQRTLLRCMSRIKQRLLGSQKGLVGSFDGKLLWKSFQGWWPFQLPTQFWYNIFVIIHIHVCGRVSIHENVCIYMQCKFEDFVISLFLIFCYFTFQGV